MVKDLGSAVLVSVSSSRSGCWLGHPVAQNSRSLDPLHSHPCQDRWTLAAALWPCGSCIPGLISSSWLALMWWSWMVMALLWQS